MRPTPDPPLGAGGSISVVVCTHSTDRWELLCEAVGSLESQTRSPDEILVVVDHNDALLERATKQFPDLKVVANAAPVRGPGGARNTGMELADGSVIAFLDDDAVAEPTWLEELMSPFADPSVMIVGSLITPRWSAQPPPWFPEEFGWVLGCSYRGQVGGHGIEAVRNVIANGMAVRRASAAAGPFRVDLGRVSSVPLGCEETEWCIRVGQKFPEAKILQVPQAVLHHHVPVERTTFGRFVRHCYAEGLSKAIVVTSVGTSDGLAAERHFVAATLSSGIGRRVLQAVSGDWRAVGQAGAMVIGLGSTTIGFVAGRNGWGIRLAARWNDRGVRGSNQPER